MQHRGDQMVSHVAADMVDGRGEVVEVLRCNGVPSSRRGEVGRVCLRRYRLILNGLASIDWQAMLILSKRRLILPYPDITTECL